MNAFLDTNVIIRHLTADPPNLGARATQYLAKADQLLLADLVVAECVYVLESYYEVERYRVAAMMRSAISLQSIRVIDADLLLRSMELYEVAGLDFAEAYLVASAESSGIDNIASFDRLIDRIPTVNRVEP